MAINETFVNQHILNSVEPIKDVSMQYNLYMLITILVILILILLGFIIVLWFRNELKVYFEKQLMKHNYIKIWIIGDNKHIKEKMIQLDEFNNFTFKGRKYSLDDLRNYVIGYIKGVPVIMYDKRFILPLTINDYLLTEESKRALGITDEVLNADKTGQLKHKISALYLKIDSSVVGIVYKKKLLSDLYDMGDGNIDAIWYWMGGAFLLVLFILYVTGSLDPVLVKMGVLK